jgi:hypothetical protein
LTLEGNVQLLLLGECIFRSRPSETNRGVEPTRSIEPTPPSLAIQYQGLPEILSFHGLNSRGSKDKLALQPILDPSNQIFSIGDINTDVDTMFSKRSQSHQASLDEWSGSLSLPQAMIICSHAWLATVEDDALDSPVVADEPFFETLRQPLRGFIFAYPRG